MKRHLVLAVVTLLLLGPGLASARGEAGQTAPAAVSPPHDAAAHDQTAAAPSHDHAATPAAQTTAAPSEIDVLLKKMQRAKGQARIAIMADLITKLAAEHQAAKTSATATNTGMCGGHDSASGGEHDMPCPMCAAHMKADHSK